jgi:hypothetical protein
MLCKVLILLVDLFVSITVNLVQTTATLPRVVVEVVVVAALVTVAEAALVVAVEADVAASATVVDVVVVEAHVAAEAQAPIVVDLVTSPARRPPFKLVVMAIPKGQCLELSS